MDRRSHHRAPTYSSRTWLGTPFPCLLRPETAPKALPGRDWLSGRRFLACYGLFLCFHNVFWPTYARFLAPSTSPLALARVIRAGQRVKARTAL